MNLLKLLLVAALAGMATPRSASAISIDFLQSGFSGGGLITGSFAGVDTNNNGQLSTFDGELNAFAVSFSGNSSVQPFSLGFSDLLNLVYDLNSPFLGDGFFEGIEASGPAFTFAYVTGQGPLGINGGEVSGPIGSSRTELAVVVTPSQVSGSPVPEGGYSFTFLGFALAATYAMSKRLGIADLRA